MVQIVFDQEELVVAGDEAWHVDLNYLAVGCL